MSLIVRIFTVLLFLQFVESAAWAEIKRPETLEDTLKIQLKALQADPRITNARIDLADESIKYTLREATVTAYPNNLHVILQRASTDEDRQKELDEFIKSTLKWADEDEKEPALKVSNILPIIRNVSTFKSLKKGDLLSSPVTGELRMYLVEDAPENTSYVMPYQIAALNLTEKQIFERAVENQIKRNWRPKIEGDGIYFFVLDGVYESSLLFDKTLWDNIEKKIGPVVVSVPNRDILLFAAKENVEHRNRLHEISKSSFSSGNYRISDELLTRGQTGWQLFQN